MNALVAAGFLLSTWFAWKILGPFWRAWKTFSDDGDDGIDEEEDPFKSVLVCGNCDLQTMTARRRECGFVLCDRCAIEREQGVNRFERNSDHE